LVENDQILLIQLQSPVVNKAVWLPPGGGVKTGELSDTALKREFIEETGLRVKVSGLRIVHELVKPPYHAIEMYFECHKTGGRLKLGHDPELRNEDQILLDLKFIPIKELDNYDVYPGILKKGIHEIITGSVNILHSYTYLPV
jgi:8-oxo-dGTP diphosphatase